MKRTEKSKTPTTPARRLKVKKEVLRHLTPEDLGLVQGGIGCTRSRPPGGGSECC